MNKLELVFVPAPGVSHLISVCKFAEKLVNRDERLCATFLIIRPPPPVDASVDAYIKQKSSDSQGSRIRYITLAKIKPPPSDEIGKSIDRYISLFLANCRSLVKEAIISNKRPDSKIIGLVFDMLCSSMIDVANELGFPSYLFLVQSAGFLGFTLYMSIWRDQVGREFNQSDADVKIPIFSHPVPAKALPSFAFIKEGYDTFCNHGVRYKETKGILINTVAEFESHAVNSLASDPELPPVYTVGLLLDAENQKPSIQAAGSRPDLENQKGKGNSTSEDEEIIKWLDQQPTASVLFLCFGTGGVFQPPQLVEMAISLERSGVRFVWSMRLPANAETTKLKEILPEGFLERTKNSGVVCGWAPQTDILAHKATGAFVSHCGWNSIVESIWYGVPIVTWPLYAEQQINAFQLVRDLEVAVELTLDYRMQLSGQAEIVKAEVIEKAIRCIMDSENPQRKRAKDMGEICRKALMEGGSSFISLERFVETILDS